MNKFKEILKTVFRRDRVVAPEAVALPKGLSDRDLNLLKSVGATYDTLLKSMQESTAVNYERSALYRELERSQTHWLMGAAVDLFADFSTPYNVVQGKSIWCNSKEKKYQRTIEKFLEEQDLEEKIYDWAATLAGFGDLMMSVKGHPGLGVISFDDSYHPSAVSRIDYDGVLLGFYRTPFDTGGMAASASESEASLEAPWNYVHFRLLGGQMRRPGYSDPVGGIEHRTIYLMGSQPQQISVRYGTSLLFNGLPVYKRLRLAEDALLLARLTRGIQRYVYKIRVDPQNPEIGGALVQEYMNILKHARAINTNIGEEHYENKSNQLSSMEDLFIPVFGDSGDVTFDKIGGEPDIKWIVDLEELRNQLACSLRVPLSLLGGYIQEASGQLGSDSIEQLDLRFARSSKRLQRGIINGVRRLCQIHLAYLGMDPDPRLFDIQMGENSTAEEKILKEALETSTDIVQKFMDMVDRLEINVDKIKLLEYLNKKVLKLNDFDLRSFIKTVTPELEGEGLIPEKGLSIEEPERPVETEAPEFDIPEIQGETPIVIDSINKEFYSYLPMRKNIVSVLSNLNESSWNDLYKNQKVIIKNLKG